MDADAAETPAQPTPKKLQPKKVVIATTGVALTGAALVLLGGTVLAKSEEGKSSDVQQCTMAIEYGYNSKGEFVYWPNGCRNGEGTPVSSD